jgi:hypothetical protein
MFRGKKDGKAGKSFTFKLNWIELSEPFVVVEEGYLITTNRRGSKYRLWVTAEMMDLMVNADPSYIRLAVKRGQANSRTQR